MGQNPTTRQAIETTRDNNGIVRFTDTGVDVEFKAGVPLAADKLVQETGWVISPITSSREGLYLYSSY